MIRILEEKLINMGWIFFAESTYIKIEGPDGALEATKKIEFEFNLLVC